MDENFHVIETHHIFNFVLLFRKISAFSKIKICTLNLIHQLYNSNIVERKFNKSYKTFGASFEIIKNLNFQNFISTIFLVTECYR